MPCHQEFKSHFVAFITAIKLLKFLNRVLCPGKEISGGIIVPEKLNVRILSSLMVL